MSIHFSEGASDVRPDSNHTSAQIPVGSIRRDNAGNEYMYVGASGVALGAPVKHVSGNFSACVVGTAQGNVLGVATAEFPTTGYPFGFIGIKGVHSTKVPSGTAAGAVLAGGNGSTAAIAAPSGTSAATFPTKYGISQEAAQNDGSAIDVFWF